MAAAPATLRRFAEVNGGVGLRPPSRGRPFAGAGGRGGFFVPRSQLRRGQPQVPARTRGSEEIAGEGLVARPKRDRAPGPPPRQSEAVQLSPSELSSAIRVASQDPKRSGDLRVWREYGEAVLFHAGGLLPKHLAFITNGFARAQVPDGDVFRRLAERAIEQADDFEPRDTALFLNAYAKLAFVDRELFQRFSAAIRSNPTADTGYGEQQLGLVVNSYARLEFRDDALFRTLGDWIGRKSMQLTPQSISVVANAYARILSRDVALFGHLSAGIKRHMDEFGPQDVANILNAYAKLRLDTPEVVSRLVEKVPGFAMEFRPLEVAAVAGALTRLAPGEEGGHRRALNALAAVVRESGSAFRARQLASTLHAFSMLTVTYGSLFVDASPYVLACARDADSQGLVLLFCSYARVGQPEGRVLRELIQRLEDLVGSLEPQALVNLFYACGRLALHREVLVQRLAEALQPMVRQMEAQHTTNCLFASSRLGVSSDEVRKLVAGLQARLAYGSLTLQPQHCANALYALTALHDSRARPICSPSGEVVKVPPPDHAVAAIVRNVLASVASPSSSSSSPANAAEWAERPQLLASICASCAQLSEASAPLFAAASRVVRASEGKRPKLAESCAGRRLSHQCVADLLGAFALVGFLDLDLFSWAMARLESTEPGMVVPAAALTGALEALDFASGGVHKAVSSAPLPGSSGAGARGAPSDVLDEGDEPPGMLFFDCPRAFRRQVVGFYLCVGRTFLNRAGELGAGELDKAVGAFARAGLLGQAPPFDLLGASACAKASSASRAIPFGLRAPLAPLSEQLEDEGIVIAESGSEGLAPIVPRVEGETIFDRLMAELEVNLNEHVGKGEAVVVARRLARYTSLLVQRVAPPSILDPIIGRLSERLASLAAELAFEDVASAMGALAEVGVWPRAAVSALAAAAENSFPLPPTFRGEVTEVERNTASVATLLLSFQAAGSDAFSYNALRNNVNDYAVGLASSAAAAAMVSPSPPHPLVLGERPTRTIAALVAALGKSTVAGVGSTVRCLVAVVVHSQLLPALSEAAAIHEPSLQEFDDMASLLHALLPLLVVQSSDYSASIRTRRGEEDQLLEGAVTLSVKLLARGLAGPRPYAAVPQRRCLELLRALVAHPARPGAAHDEANREELVAALLQRLVRSAQGSVSDLADALDCLASLRMPAALSPVVDEAAALAARVPAAAIAATAAQELTRARAASPEALGLGAAVVEPTVVADIGGPCEALLVVKETLSKQALALLRALLAHLGRMPPAEAARGAHFCAMALDARILSEKERADVSSALARLLERACWEKARWAAEDRRLLIAVGTLLRSEYPELLRDRAWASRSTLAALEELRGARL